MHAHPLSVIASLLLWLLALIHGRVIDRAVSGSIAVRDQPLNIASINSTQIPDDLPDGPPIPDLAEDPPPPLDDAAWDAQVCKGAALLDLMRLSDTEAGSRMNPPMQSINSQWQDFPNDFAKWGYRSNQRGAPDMSQRAYGIESFLDAVGGSRNPSDWQMWQTAQGNFDVIEQLPIDNQIYTDPDGYSRRCSGARFNIGVEEEHGILLLEYLLGAVAANREFRQPRIQDYELPPLQRASDIIWGMYWAITEHNKRLKYVLNWAINNMKTRATIVRAIQNGPPERPGGDPRNNRMRYWPGQYFPASDPSCQALIGSPNGELVAWLLIQHKEGLGRKTITGCRIFAANSILTLGWPSLLMYVEDVQ